MAALTPNWDLEPDSPLQRLFKTVDNPLSTKRSVVAKGSIITFNYVGQTRHRIHDPQPLVIVCDIFSDMVRAVNLHYMTLPYVKNIVSTYANNPQFSFRFISGDSYIVGAFRSYKIRGISQIKMLDAGFLQNLLKVTRSLEPGEIEQMRSQVKDLMMQETAQPPAQAGPELT